MARLLLYEAFSPEDVSVITEVFESAVSVLQLTDRAGSLTTERVAKKIVECAQTGERDPIRLRSYRMDEWAHAPTSCRLHGSASTPPLLE